MRDLLRAANKKFIARFEEVEKKLAAIGKRPIDSNLDEMNNIWKIVKNSKYGNNQS